MAKKPTSVRLTSENDAKIKALAKRDNLSSSQIINKIINEYSGKKTEMSEDSLSIISKEINTRFDTIEREVGMQRQRVNILKNQVDLVLKNQDGKGRSDRYTDYNKPK